MAVNFLPGEPNKTPQATSQALWQTHVVFAYCSGNNLCILTDFSILQTVYLPQDATCCDINPATGFIAVATGSTVKVYKPLQGKWVLCSELSHDNSSVTCLKWARGNDRNELVLGSAYLSLWRIEDNFGNYDPLLCWTQKQAQPVYMCDISPDGQLIASIGRYDCLVKVWNRISISGDVDLFDLSYCKHSDVVTGLRWKKSAQETYILYTWYSGGLNIWASFELDGTSRIQNWGNIRNNSKYIFLLDSISGEADLAYFGNHSGEMDVYALENLSRDPPKLLNVVKLPNEKPPWVKNPTFLFFPEAVFNNGAWSIVIHDINGVLRHLKIVPGKNAVLEHKLTGHNKSVQKLVRSSDGSAMLSLSRFSDNCIWIPQTLADGVVLKKQSVIKASIHDATVIEKGNVVITYLDSHELVLWDCTKKEAKAIDRLKLHTDKSPLIMVNTPEKFHRHDRHYFAVVYSKDDIRGFEISPNKISPKLSSGLPLEHDIHLIAKIDPVAHEYTSERSLLSSISPEGAVSCFKAQVDKKINWIKTFEIETHIVNATCIRGSSVDKMCVAAAKEMSIWDVRQGLMEYKEVFEEQIYDIDWTSTRQRQSMMALGFRTSSLVYTQLRYDYTNYQPSYLPIRRLDISKYTSHSIGDSTWLADGTLAVATGNQFFVSDKRFESNDPSTKKALGSRTIKSNDILSLCSALNGPLPLYHPQLLVQALFNDKLQLVREILLKLFLELKSSDEILPDLGFDTTKFYFPYKMNTYDEPYTEFSPQVAQLLVEQLTKVTLPFITRHQQKTLLTVVESVNALQANRQVLDSNGLRFLLGVKLFQAHKKSQPSVTMRDINWATHSDNKEMLLQLLTPLNTWNEAKQYGLAYWARHDDLVNVFEKIAKFEFSQCRNPSKCMIFYLALKKKQILVSLWKTAAGNPEQQKMIKFLSNDFTQDRWRSAALKNAFVLMSKHRYTDAASFFLLGGSLKDAVSVANKQMGDRDLAIALCRIYEGDNGPVLDNLLENTILPVAIENNDRWTTSYIFWKLRKPEIAIQALMKQPIDCVPSSTIEPVSRSFLEDDPVLLILFRQLRKRNLKYYIGSMAVEAEEEVKFIKRVSSIYTRMGCDYLVIDILKHWSFVEQKNVPTVTMRRDSITSKPQELASPKPKSKQKQPPPEAFAEPDMSAFGF